MMDDALEHVITDDLPEEVVKLLALSYVSTEAFCKFFFPARFRLPFSRFHKRLFEAIDDPSVKQLAVAMPRGTGKTSILNFALPIKHILFRTSKFIIPVSCSEDMAMQQSENMKKEIESNYWIAKLFGVVERERFYSQKRWTAFDTMVLPRGMGQQIRGWLYGDARPDLILIDDLEDRRKMKSEEYRRDCQHYFFEDLLNVVDRASDNWRIILLCTVSHPDCLIYRLREDPSWTVFLEGIRDENGESTWPEFKTTEEIAELEKSFAIQGMMEAFYNEYLSIPYTGGGYGFSPDMFRYYDESEIELNEMPMCESAVILDPAQTMKEGSAHTAIVGVTVNHKTGVLYVREVVDGVMGVDEVMDQMVAVARRINADVIAPEVTGAEAYVMWPIEQRLRNEGMFRTEVIPIRPRDKKQKRAGALLPLYRKGMVYHRKPPVCSRLEAQLLSFPRPHRWDMIDALAHVIPLFYEGDRYLAPPVDEPDYDAELGEEQLVIDYGI